MGMRKKGGGKGGKERKKERGDRKKKRALLNACRDELLLDLKKFFAGKTAVLAVLSVEPDRRLVPTIGKPG